MTKRIFRTIFLVALGVFLASVVLFMTVLYDYFSAVGQNQLKMHTELAAQGVYHEGSEYFEELEAKNYRITWIGTDGKILYDSVSDADEMENHFEREEVKEALAEGYGQSARYRSLSSVLCTHRIELQVVSVAVQRKIFRTQDHTNLYRSIFADYDGFMYR